MPTLIDPDVLKADIDADITDKTAPYSIDNIDVGNLLKSIVDYINQEMVNQTRIETLITTADPQPYTILAGNMLEILLLIPLSNASPYASTVGGDPGDIVPQDADNIVTAVNGAIWQLNLTGIGVDKLINIAGMPVGSTLIFLTRKII